MRQMQESEFIVSILLAIPEESKQAVKEKRDEERLEAEAVVKDKLSLKHGESLDEDVLNHQRKWLIKQLNLRK